MPPGIGYGKGYKKGSMSKSKSSGKSMKGKSMKHYGRSEAVGGYVEKRMVGKGPYAPK